MWTIELSEDEKFWQCFEDGNARTSFLEQIQAIEWCELNNIEYTLVEPK
jgi:hypothetical protein